jgi:hypothetical protein
MASARWISAGLMPWWVTNRTRSVPYAPPSNPCFRHAATNRAASMFVSLTYTMLGWTLLRSQSNPGYLGQALGQGARVLVIIG